MLIELESPEHHYVDEVARNHLGLGLSLPPALTRSPSPSVDEILACHRAHRVLRDAAPALARYFFKRYRSLLLERVAAAQTLNPAVARKLDVDARRVLESQDEEDHHTLDFLAVLAPPELKKLFPAALAEAGGAGLARPSPSFSCETDARLYHLAVDGVDDPAAAALRQRLEQLDGSEVYRTLPAELLVQLARAMYRVLTPAGDTLIWQGSSNDDVFMLVRGELEVLFERDGVVRRVNVIRPGEVFGDMAFVSGEARSASLRATVASECLVLHSTSLKPLAYENPALLMRMARVLARRLGAMMARA